MTKPAVKKSLVLAVTPQQVSILAGIIVLYIPLYIFLYPVIHQYAYCFSIIIVMYTGWIAGPVPGGGSTVLAFFLNSFLLVISGHATAGLPAGDWSWIHYILAIPLGVFSGTMRMALQRGKAEAIRSENTVRELISRLDRQDDYLYMAQKSARIGTWEMENGTHALKISLGMKSLLGLPGSEKEFPLDRFMEMTVPEDRAEFQRKIGEVPRAGYVEFEQRVVSQGGKIRTFFHKMREERTPDDNPGGISGTIQDITDTKANENEIRKLTVAIQNSRDWIVITDLKGKVEYMNSTVLDISGFTHEEIMEHGLHIWKSGIHSPDFYRILWETLLRGESFRSLFICRKKNAELFYLDQTIIPVRDSNGRITHFVGAGKDVTQTKQMEERLNHLSFYDALTNLPNRHLFTERLRHAILQAQKNHSTLAVLSLDINRFRLINDSFGPKTGDDVLKTVAARLSTCIREGDTVARLGNDEWGVVLTEVLQAKSIIQTVETILLEAGKPIAIDEEEIVLSLCAGISIFPEDGKNPTELIRNAEVALIKAKEDGKNRYHFFTADLNRKASEFIQMERDLFRAVENKEFVIYYQPYYNIADLSCKGMEALLRWRRKGGGLIQPGDFIPILEETGMIIEVGIEVIRMTAAQIRSWLEAGYPLSPISINLSALQFRQNDLAETIVAITREYDVDPKYIIFEITESTFMQDLEHTRSTLWKLRDLGFMLSIDDFGTGYSSLSYLKRFPVNTLKIDKSFIADLPKRGDDLSIVRAIISMAKSLNLRTIAEGVQDMESLSILREEGCDIAQGYFFSPPVPPEVIERTLFSGTDTRVPEEDRVPTP